MQAQLGRRASVALTHAGWNRTSTDPVPAVPTLHNTGIDLSGQRYNHLFSRVITPSSDQSIPVNTCVGERDDHSLLRVNHSGLGLTELSSGNAAYLANRCLQD